MVFDTGWHTVVGKWNGTSWSSLATGSPMLDSFQQIWKIITDTIGNIYICGSFGSTGSLENVAKWDGTSWSKVGALNANSDIITICFDRHYNLYAAGAFTDGVVDALGHPYVAKWDGTSWTELGTGTAALNPNSKINCLYIDSSDNIYAAGAFTDSASFIGGNVYVAKWDGTSWSELGAGVLHQDFSYNTQIGVIVGDAGGNLYVTGRMADDSGFGYIAKWDGVSWSEVGTGIHSLKANNGIRTLLIDKDGDLCAAGSFTDGSSYSTGNHYVAKWDGTSWSHLGSGGFTDNIYSSAISAICSDDNGNIYAAGTFTDTTITLTDSFHSYHPVYVAKYTFSLAGVPETTQVSAISVYPNPATDIVNITADNTPPARYTLSDMLGRECRRGQVHSGTSQVDIRDLPPGAYVLRISNTGNVFKIVKE